MGKGYISGPWSVSLVKNLRMLRQLPILLFGDNNRKVLRYPLRDMQIRESTWVRHPSPGLTVRVYLRDAIMACESPTKGMFIPDIRESTCPTHSNESSHYTLSTERSSTTTSAVDSWSGANNLFDKLGLKSVHAVLIGRRTSRLMS